jgi:formamidopyrimidine-DNA glycosylase
VLIDLVDGRQLCFHDTRKFGRMHLVTNPAPLLAKLGPEPLSGRFTARRLSALLHPRRRQLKPLLLDQAFLAGIGNIYADEALWRARLHPCRQADSLTEEEIRRLHRAIRKVLRDAIDHQGTTFGEGLNGFRSVGRNRGRNREHLMVFRRTHAPCYRCGEPINRIRVAQRSTHLCAACQRM